MNFFTSFLYCGAAITIFALLDTALRGAAAKTLESIRSPEQSKDAQEKIKAGLAGNPMVTLHVYEGNDHAFAREGGAHYDAEAAKLANQRSADFFKQNLS